MQRSAVFALLATLVLLACAACGPKTTTTDGGPTDEGGGPKDKPVVKAEALEEFTKAVAVIETNPTQAMQLFSAAIDEDESFGEAWYNLGLLQEAAGKTDEALESYQKAVDSRPRMAEPRVNLAILLIAKGDVGKAKEHLVAVVDDENGIDPFHVEANLNLGMLYRLEGEAIVAKANEVNEATVEIAEGEFVTRKYILPEEAKPLFAEAVRHVRKALAGDSNNINCYENLAAIYYDMDNLEVARLVCEQAIQKQIDLNKQLDDDLAANRISADEHKRRSITNEMMAPTYNTFGLVWLARGEVALAYHHFKTAVELKPNFREALFNVAGVAVNVQDYVTAYEKYGVLLQLEPKNREARLSQAVAARGLGNLDEAEKVYDAMLAEDKNYAPALFNKAILYQEYHRELTKAKQLYEEFMAMPSAMEMVPARVAEAKQRIEQIEQIWAAQKSAEEEQRKIQKEMEEIKRLQEEQRKKQEAESGAQPTDGTTPAPEGTTP